MRYNKQTDWVQIQADDGSWVNWKVGGLLFDGFLYNADTGLGGYVKSWSVASATGSSVIRGDNPLVLTASKGYITVVSEPTISGNLISQFNQMKVTGNVGTATYRAYLYDVTDGSEKALIEWSSSASWATGFSKTTQLQGINDSHEYKLAFNISNSSSTNYMQVNSVELLR